MKFSIWSLLILLPLSAMSQPNETDATRWLAKAPPVPIFETPVSKQSWEKKRREIRATTNELLGKLPLRPKLPVVKTVSKEDRGDYLLEKFEFDNEAGATVPGYLLLPKQTKGKS